MTYNELLAQKEWWSKCNEILSRDHFTCQDCGSVGFHNDYSFATIDDICVIDNILSSWEIDGNRITHFCSSIMNYNLEHFEGVELREAEPFSQNNYRLSFRLFDKGSKYFYYHPRGLSYGNFISDLPCEKIDMDGILLHDVISHNSVEPAHSWLYAFKFEKALADKVYLSINGSNSFSPSNDELSLGSYVIRINSGDILIVLCIEATGTVIFKGLNVHHNYYIEGRKPWEYDNDAIVTLCKDCHKKRHENSSVRYYDHENRFIGTLKVCDRCGGSGYLSQYSHVENGICFKCGGEGVIIID